METDGRHDYLICKELLVGFVVTGLDCLEAREWVVDVCECECVCAHARMMCVNVPGCGWPVFACGCPHVSVHLFACLNALHWPLEGKMQRKNTIVSRSKHMTFYLDGAKSNDKDLTLFHTFL